MKNKLIIFFSLLVSITAISQEETNSFSLDAAINCP